MMNIQQIQKLLEIEGNQKADKEAIGQCFDQIKALYDYLGLTYVSTVKQAIKTREDK